MRHNPGNLRQQGFLGYRPQAAGDEGWGRMRGQEGRSHQQGAPYDNGGQNNWGRNNTVPPLENRGMLLGDILRQAPQYSANATFDQRPPTWDHIMSPPTQAYESKGQDHTNGAFAQAMSRITSNPTSANQGSGEGQNLFSREFFQQLQMALSIQMGLNGPQQIKEHALHNVLVSQSARGDMRQVLRSRASIYEDELDPNWFKPKTDLGGKATTMVQRNKARAQLAGAPLLVAQVGAMEFRKKLLQGDQDAIKGLRLGDTVTVAEMLKILGRIPPISTLQLCNPQAATWMKEHLLQHGDDLDYVQDVLTATGENTELNPILNGVLAGFARRKRHGRFKHGPLNLEFDRLRYANTATPKDSDLATLMASQKKKQPDTNNSCHFFQQAVGCTYGMGCRFKHKCVVCGKSSHGASDCPDAGRSSGRKRDRLDGRQEADTQREQERPPNSRKRRSRANVNNTT